MDMKRRGFGGGGNQSKTIPPLPILTLVNPTGADRVFREIEDKSFNNLKKFGFYINSKKPSLDGLKLLVKYLVTDFYTALKKARTIQDVEKAILDITKKLDLAHIGSDVNGRIIQAVRHVLTIKARRRLGLANGKSFFDKFQGLEEKLPLLNVERHSEIESRLEEMEDLHGEMIELENRALSTIAEIEAVDQRLFDIGERAKEAIKAVERLRQNDGWSKPRNPRNSIWFLSTQRLYHRFSLTISRSVSD